MQWMQWFLLSWEKNVKIRFKLWSIIPHETFLRRACVNFVSIFHYPVLGFFSPHLLWYFNYNTHNRDFCSQPVEQSWSLSMHRKKCSLLWWFWISQRPITCTVPLENPAFLVHFSMNNSTSIIQAFTALNLKTTQSVHPPCLSVLSQLYGSVLFHCTWRWGEYKLPIVTDGQKVKGKRAFR